MLSVLNPLGLNNDGYGDNWRNWNIKTRVIHAVIAGIDKCIEQDSVELTNDIGALKVIEEGLMESTNIIRETIL